MRKKRGPQAAETQPTEPGSLDWLTLVRGRVRVHPHSPPTTHTLTHCFEV